MRSLAEFVRGHSARVGGEKPSLLSGYDTARRSWAQKVRTNEEIPEIYQEFFEGLPFQECDPLPYMVVTPTFKGYLRAEREKLICLTGRKIYIVERAGNAIVATCYPLDDIYCIETGMVLLYSWLTISGLDSSGQRNSSTFKFNLVTEHLFAPFVESMRPAIVAAKDHRPGSEMACFDPLRQSNFKFMNYAKRSVRPGENVVQFIMQPEIRAEVLRVFHKSISRIISTVHIVVLTDSGLILIREEETQRLTKNSRYGGVWSYIPLRKVCSASLIEKDEYLLAPSVCLPAELRLEALFQASKKVGLEQIVSRLGVRPV